MYWHLKMQFRMSPHPIKLPSISLQNVATALRREHQLTFGSLTYKPSLELACKDFHNHSFRAKAIPKLQSSLGSKMSSHLKLSKVDPECSHSSRRKNRWEAHSESPYAWKQGAPGRRHDGVPEMVLIQCCGQVEPQCLVGDKQNQEFCLVKVALPSFWQD